MLPAAAWAMLLVLVVLPLCPRTRPSYEAYFYPDYRKAYMYFADRDAQTIYAYGLRPYFLLGQRAQHRVIYDLNPTEELLKDPAAFVRRLSQCVSPDFLVFSDYLIGNGYFPKVLIEGVEVVDRDDHFVILRLARKSQRSHGTDCPARYAMAG